MKHGKNQQHKGHLKHLANKRLRQQAQPSQPQSVFDSWDDAVPSRPPRRTLRRVPNAPGFIQKEFIDRQAAEEKRALLAYQAGYVRGLLEQVRDLLLRRIDQLMSQVTEADIAAVIEDVDRRAVEANGWTREQNRLASLVGNDLLEELEKEPAPVSEPFQVDDKPATAAEVKKMVAAATQAPVKVVCPLCNSPITFEDAIHNCTVVTLNKQPVQVHKNCPGEK